MGQFERTESNVDDVENQRFSQSPMETRGGLVGPREILSRYKEPLSAILPYPDFSLYLRMLHGHIDKLLNQRPLGRTFTVLSAMDNDSMASVFAMKYLFPDIPVSVVYPKLSNTIDHERSGRRDTFVSRYNIPVLTVEDAYKLQRDGDSLPSIALYEFSMDEVLDVFKQSSGLSSQHFTTADGLTYNNALGTICNLYWKNIANSTHGLMVGILNGTSLRLGDYYRYALDGEIYPLAPLFRTDVDRLLKFLQVPAKLRHVTPWSQKVRAKYANGGSDVFWEFLDRQKTDKSVYLLPRNFYRIADPVIYLLEEGFNIAGITQTIVESVRSYCQKYNQCINQDELIMIRAMVQAAITVYESAKHKYNLDKARFPDFAVAELDVEPLK